MEDIDLLIGKERTQIENDQMSSNNIEEKVPLKMGKGLKNVHT